MMDTTERTVLSLVYSGVARAHGATAPEHAHPDLEPCLVCDHELGAHHGPHGEQRCGEDGCGCTLPIYRSQTADGDASAGTPDHNRRV